MTFSGISHQRRMKARKHAQRSLFVPHSAIIAAHRSKISLQSLRACLSPKVTLVEPGAHHATPGAVRRRPPFRERHPYLGVPFLLLRRSRSMSLCAVLRNDSRNARPSASDLMIETHNAPA